MQNINIVFLVEYLSKNGGTERVTSVIINELIKLNYKVTVISLEDNKEEIFFPFSPAVNIFYLNLSHNSKGFSKLIPAIKQIRTFNKENKTDVFIAVEAMLTLFSVPALAGTSIKLIVWEHFNFNVDLGKKARRIARQIAVAFADNVITLTKRDIELWNKNSWFKKADIINIPNPVFIQEKPLLSSKPCKTVIAVGRLTHQKGFDLAIDAWHEISVHSRKGWRLQIVGEGEARSMLEKKISDYGLSDSVELTGSTKKVFDYFQNASILCLSSRFEGLPMVLIEALSFQLPIVAFDCDTGPREIIDVNKNGLLVEPENVSRLSESLEYLMKNDAVREQMASYRSPKLELLNLPSIIKKWHEVIQQKAGV